MRIVPIEQALNELVRYLEAVGVKRPVACASQPGRVAADRET